MNSAVTAFFHRSVPDAIGLAQKQHKPLFIFISNEGKESEKFFNFYFREDLPKAFLDSLGEYFVCLLVEEGTLDARNFSEILPRAVFPAFYIVQKGILLDVIEKSTSFEKFYKCIDNLTSGSKKPVAKSVTELMQKEEFFDTSGSIFVRAKSSEMGQDVETESLNLKMNKYSIDDSKGLRRNDNSGGFKNVKKGALGVCKLSIRLFDGEAVIKSFSSNDRLVHVRKWLDENSKFKVLPDSNSSLPSFAHSSIIEPSGYMFFQAGISGTTFSESMERYTLKELGLPPRAALILKPIYEEASASEVHTKRNMTMLKSLGQSCSRFVHALYSFFDYGVDANSGTPDFGIMEDKMLTSAKDFNLKNRDLGTTTPHGIKPLRSLESSVNDGSLVSAESTENFTPIIEGSEMDSGSIILDKNIIEVSRQSNTPLAITSIPSVTKVNGEHSNEHKVYKEDKIKESFIYSNASNGSDDDL